MEQELLDYYDEKGNCLGTAPREEVHRRGLLHHVVHFWMITPGSPACNFPGLGLWCQKRSPSKTDFPNMYDILAMGGHIDAGESPDKAVLREIWEELGIRFEASQVERLDARHPKDWILPGFIDREIAWVYAARLPEPPVFACGEEVAQMVWVPLAEILKKELHQAQEIKCFPLGAGEAIVTGAAEWLPSDGEFQEVVLPLLKDSIEICPNDAKGNDRL